MLIDQGSRCPWGRQRREGLLGDYNAITDCTPTGEGYTPDTGNRETDSEHDEICKYLYENTNEDMHALA